MTDHPEDRIANEQLRCVAAARRHLLDAERAECERLRAEVDGLRRAMRACETALELMAVDRAAGRDDTGHFSDAINAIGDFRRGEKDRERKIGNFG